MKSTIPLLAAALLATALPAAAHAQAGIETLIGQVSADPGGGILLDIRLLNTGTAPTDAHVAETVAAQLTVPGAAEAPRTVHLRRAPATPARITVSPGTFATVQYRVEDATVAQGSLLHVNAWSAQAVALPAAAAAVVTQGPEHAEVQSAPPAPNDRTVGNAFLANLSVYEPIYAVYGPNTNSEARIQISFKYQLFGSRSRRDRNSFLDGFHFAYTQRMFWDLEAYSSPFRNIDFQPELFYATPARPLASNATLGAQIGIRHESNGRDGGISRSVGIAYIAPVAAISLAPATRLTVSPRAWVYVGDRSDNPDIAHYRGNTGLYVEIGQDDGLRLSTTSRFNFSSGKGSVAADLSFPLRSLLGGGPDFYLFGQSFTGYGENLLDYNRRVTRLRIGMALVR